MATDVVLDGHDGSWVVIEGHALQAKVSDVLVDSAERRGGKAGEYRRALVHTEGDGLAINFGNDYTGGLTLHGVAGILPVPAAPKQPNEVFGALPTLVIYGGISFQMGSPARPNPVGVNYTTVDLGAYLGTLQSEINSLTKRIAALEA